MYVFSGWDYRIDVLSTVSGATVKRFKRTYPKARLILTDAQEEDRRKNNLPKYDYRPDIDNLYPLADRLWVETSTEDKAKGRLCDVFDKDGRFVDSFYLGPGKTLMAVRRGSFSVRKRTKTIRSSSSNTGSIDAAGSERDEEDDMRSSPRRPS